MTDNHEIEEKAVDAELLELEQPETSPPPKNTAKLALLVSVIAMIVVIVLSWFGWKAWQTLEQLNSQNASLTQSLQNQTDNMRSVSAQAERVDDLLQSQEGLRDRLGEVETALGESTATSDAIGGQVSQLKGQISAVQKGASEISAKLGSNSRRAWLEAEVEFLLRIANQALLFKADHASAIRALEAADERLVTLDDPGFYKVREAIASEISAINNASRPDTVGMALSLAGAIEGVVDLPLYNATPDQFKRAEDQVLAEEPTQVEERTLKSFANDIWAQFKQLVAVRRDDAPYQPLLTADQTTNLYSNLELKLEAARVALLRGDKVLFDQSLDMADQWLANWFDTGSNAVSVLRQRIEALKEQPMIIETPDISTSLQRLVDVMESRDRAAGDR